MMNIETADRLLAYRKKLGLSQEELAERIGVSRQAVSKWERAEASPDTENLIQLSKIFGVTLDEMLCGKPESDSESEDRSSEAEYEAARNDFDDNTQSGFNLDSDGDKVHISLDGIHVKGKNGDKVDISREGVFVEKGGEQKVYTDSDGHIHKSADVLEKEAENKDGNVLMKLPYPLITVIAYILFGIFNIMGGWAYGWIVFLTIPLYYTLIEAILKHRLRIFCYPVLVAVVYLIIGFSLSWWHPGWVLFLTIPLFYWVGGKINTNK